MAPPFYITTPIYYVNAKPHLGHAYTTIVADAIRRFHQMRGAETFFLTGTDEHGDKIERAARKENLEPKAYADCISELFRELWPKLNAGFDKFIRTTDPDHIRVVQHILQKIYENGDIYFSEYEGLYCYGCERFYTERELVDGKCPDHQVAPDTIREANYFFRMSRYQQWLIDHIQENADFIRPERYRNEVLSFLKDPLDDLCISRPKKRLQWGISLPFDDQYVTYVWFDALLNYVSALAYPDGERYRTFWPHAQHIVAKDILKPHGIYWPTMLRAAGIPVYRHLNVHGYWNVDESKMSKSIGNVVDPLKLVGVYGLDAFRFFLLRDMAFGLDSNFSEVALVQRINSDLANDLGNLFSRTLTMIHKYRGGTIPAAKAGAERDFDLHLSEAARELVAEYDEAMETFGFHRALAAVWQFINRMNKVIDVSAPWVLAKDPAKKDHLDAVLYHLAEGLRIVSGLLYPVMPETSSTMQRHLGMDPEKPYYLLERLRAWGELTAGTLLPETVSLFPRVDPKSIRTAASESARPTPSPQESKEKGLEEIEIPDFQKIELRTGTVIRAEKVPKADRLLKLEVDIGEVRTVVAGIAQQYRPEDLIGKQVIIVANLKPAKIMGIESRGMLLAAAGKQVEALATLDREVPPGLRLR
ncbi:MAG: methionine--tRNA ligase [Desulfobacteraceae bacterium]|nr:methionine--tRNA ligase [Desulfobacteraceae bacterium]